MFEDFDLGTTYGIILLVIVIICVPIITVLLVVCCCNCGWSDPKADLTDEQREKVETDSKRRVANRHIRESH